VLAAVREAGFLPTERALTLASCGDEAELGGRLAAAGVDPDSLIPTQRRPAERRTDETGTENVINVPGFAEAATVIIPVVQNRAEPEGSDAPGRHGSAEPREIIETAEITVDPRPSGRSEKPARPDKDA
jgi:hypothetical protein